MNDQALQLHNHPNCKIISIISILEALHLEILKKYNLERMSMIRKNKSFMVFRMLTYNSNSRTSSNFLSKHIPEPLSSYFGLRYRAMKLVDIIPAKEIGVVDGTEIRSDFQDPPR